MTHLMKILKSIINFFVADKVEYWHRDRSIEVIAVERKMDINEIAKNTLETIKIDGRIQAIKNLRHQFHVPLSAAWRFVNKIDKNNDA